MRFSQSIRGRFAILHVVSTREGASRFGIALTRRLMPLSVDRNRVKRIAREVFRRHAAKSAGVDCVLMLRERVRFEDRAMFAAEVAELFDRMPAAR